VIYGVDVAHAVFDYTADFFETFVASHTTNSVSLDKDIALRKQFQSLNSISNNWLEEYLQCRSIWSK